MGLSVLLGMLVVTCVGLFTGKGFLWSNCVTDCFTGCLWCDCAIGCDKGCCYLAIAYITMQLHIIHQGPRIKIAYNMISKEIQNNVICISRFHGIDILILFQWGVNKVKTVDQCKLYDDF